MGGVVARRSVRREVTADRAGAAHIFHDFQGLERHGGGRHGDGEIHAGPLGPRRIGGDLAVLLAAEALRRNRGHGDAGRAPVGGGVGDGVGSDGAGGPHEGHAVRSRALAVGAPPAASRDIAHDKRGQFADPHGRAVLIAGGTGPAVGDGDRRTLGWCGGPACVSQDLLLLPAIENDVAPLRRERVGKTRETVVVAAHGRGGPEMSRPAVAERRVGMHNLAVEVDPQFWIAHVRDLISLVVKREALTLKRDDF